MRRSLQLFLPILIPSWRFFDGIAPSPRIEYAFVEDGENWIELCEKPDRVPFLSMLARLFWNPDWNQTLFLVSCSERLMEAPTDHSHGEILKQVRRAIPEQTEHSHLRFRLVFVHREGDALERDVTYLSPIHPIAP